MIVRSGSGDAVKATLMGLNFCLIGVNVGDLKRLNSMVRKSSRPTGKGGVLIGLLTEVFPKLNVQSSVKKQCQKAETEHISQQTHRQDDCLTI